MSKKSAGKRTPKTPAPEVETPVEAIEGAELTETVEAPAVAPAAAPRADGPAAPHEASVSTKFDAMGAEEVRKALADGRFTDRRADHAKVWLAKQ